MTDRGPLGRMRRRQLRDALLDVAPWLANDTFGPANVEAGLCDQCDRRPRLIATCGPDAPGSVCPECLHDLGEHAWCTGHLEEAERADAWVRALPDDWPAITVTWWIATGEVTAQAPVARAIPSSERPW